MPNLRPEQAGETLGMQGHLSSHTIHSCYDGLRHACKAANSAMKVMRHLVKCVPTASQCFSKAARSPPAQNAFSPAPVMTMHELLNGP